MAPPTTMAPPAPDFDAIKQRVRETWALGNFGDIANLVTVSTAPTLVRVAGVRAGQSVLDVGTGTGVVALAARRLGARVTGADLTPELLDQARRNGEWAGFPDVRWDVADVEKLPYPSASFDVVLSQFGHMFAPRPDVAIGEMLRVLKPGGTVAFSTWPPDSFTGRMFAAMGEFVPAPPGVAPPGQWGDPAVVRQRLGAAVTDVHFELHTGSWPGLSPRHVREVMEAKGGPTIRAVQALQSAPERLQTLRATLDRLVAEFFVDHGVRHDYLVTRAVKR